MSLVGDTLTAATLTTLRHERAQPTEAGLRPFTRTALLSATTTITTIVVNQDTTNVN
jgi:hypothetical protein